MLVCEDAFLTDYFFVACVTVQGVSAVFVFVLTAVK